MFMAAEESSSSDTKFRLPPDLKAEWLRLLARKNIKQQAAMESLIKLVLYEPDDVIQSMLLGQTRPTPEMLALLIKELSARSAREAHAAMKSKRPPHAKGESA